MNRKKQFGLRFASQQNIKRSKNGTPYTYISAYHPIYLSAYHPILYTYQPITLYTYQPLGLSPYTQLEDSVWWLLVSFLPIFSLGVDTWMGSENNQKREKISSRDVKQTRRLAKISVSFR